MPEKVIYRALQIARRLSIWVLLAVASQIPLLTFQEQDWDRIAAGAEQIYGCRSAVQNNFPDPATAALDMYQKAIQAVDQSTSDSSDARAVRGAFRANAVKRVMEIQARQTAWKAAIAEATRLHDKSLQEQAGSTLLKASPLPCWVAAKELLADIDNSRQELEEQLKEATSVLDRAQATFDLKAGAKLFRDAIDRLSTSQTYNVEDRRPSQLLAEAKAQLANITSPGKYEIVVISDPGDAKVVLKGAEERDQKCPGTPCKFKFDEAYFRKSGGSFISSRRLLAPVVAVISKPGYETVTMQLSEGEGVWNASVPGRNLSEFFYYFTNKRFQVRLRAMQK